MRLFYHLEAAELFLANAEQDLSRVQRAFVFRTPSSLDLFSEKHGIWGESIRMCLSCLCSFQRSLQTVDSNAQIL